MQVLQKLDNFFQHNTSKTRETLRIRVYVRTSQYSLMEELLTIRFGSERFREYLYSHKYVTKNSHKSLLAFVKNLLPVTIATIFLKITKL